MEQKHSRLLITSISILLVLVVFNFIFYRLEYASLQSNFNKYIDLHKRANRADEVWENKLTKEHTDYYDLSIRYQNLSRNFFQLEANTKSIFIWPVHPSLQSIKSKLSESCKTYGNICFISSNMDQDEEFGKISEEDLKQWQKLAITGTACEEDLLEQLSSISKSPILIDYYFSNEKIKKLFKKWH